MRKTYKTYENRYYRSDGQGVATAATVVQCSKPHDVITVKCCDTRHQSTPEWSICFDEQGNIVDADSSSSQTWVTRPTDKPNKKQQANAQKKQKRLDFCKKTIQEHGGIIQRKELTELLQKETDLDRSRVAGLITELIKKDKVLYESNEMITATPPDAVAA